MCHACLLAWVCLFLMKLQSREVAEAKGEGGTHPVLTLTYWRDASGLETTVETPLSSSV